MKIIVISDSHGHFKEMLSVVEKEKAEIIFFAGDHSVDCIELSYVKKDIKYYIVKGNTDINDYSTPDNLEVEMGGIKIFLTHGHQFYVKNGYSEIENEAEKREAKLVIFGHTHFPYINEKSGIVYFNPGALKDRFYGVVDIKNGKISCNYKIV